MTEQSTVDRFKHLFRGRETCHGRYYDGEDKRVVTVREPVDEAHWGRHLRGVGPYLGVVPITVDNAAYFGAIDVDDDGVDLTALERHVGELELPLVVCRSKSGGAHLYLFLREPMPAKLVVDKLKAMQAALGLDHNADGRPVEIFPKQVKLKSAADVGNWINLPYYKGDGTNRYAVLNGNPLDLLGFLDLAEGRAITGAELEILRIVAAGGNDPFAEGPPCLQALHAQGFPAGTRNQGLYNIGVFFKYADPEEWPSLLSEYNDSGKIDPPLSIADVAAIVKSLEKKDYTYKCEELPISSHCNRRLCKKRRFGITAARRKQVDDQFPELTGLQKVLTDPPKWYLTVNGEPLELSTDDLMQLPRFRKTCMERLSLIVPMLKAHEWDEKLQELLGGLQTVEAPEDAGVYGQFKLHVSDFLAQRGKSEGREDLLAGRPVEENGRVLFRSIDLKAFLDRRKFSEYPLNRIYTALRDMGADHAQLDVKGAAVRVWTMPVPGGEQTQEFSEPTYTQPTF